MAVINLFNNPVVPSDVFGFEANTDVGYARESFEITVAGSPVRVGTILEVDHVEKTATVLAAPASAEEVNALGDLAVFVGRDIKTNPATLQDFDRLTLAETGVGVAITRGDGRGTLKKGYLDLGGTPFYEAPEAVQKALQAKLTTENRFKVQDQQYTPSV